MTRRKRGITASIKNLKRAKQLKDDHIQKPVEPEDDGEIVLWNDVLVEESDEEAEDTHGESDENSTPASLNFIHPIFLFAITGKILEQCLQQCLQLPPAKFPKFPRTPAGRRLA